MPGPTTDIADHMQDWFEDSGCDGFSLAIDAHRDSINDLVDSVIRLRERSLFHRDYDRPSLRNHIGAPAYIDSTFPRTRTLEFAGPIFGLWSLRRAAD